mmetsp:Transcript_70468/g.159402  ORF Transcript_70468/g.159402 Transcript_70468/m.159402 type:complete len:210 (+) Transcript_70468:584-1213(+)
MACSYGSGLSTSEVPFTCVALWPVNGSALPSGVAVTTGSSLGFSAAMSPSPSFTSGNTTSYAPSSTNTSKSPVAPAFCAKAEVGAEGRPPEVLFDSASCGARMVGTTAASGNLPSLARKPSVKGLWEAAMRWTARAKGSGESRRRSPPTDSRKSPTAGPTPPPSGLTGGTDVSTGKPASPPPPPPSPASSPSPNLAVAKVTSYRGLGAA